MVLVPSALINGAEIDCLTVADRGLQYGDGLFETLAVHDGAPCLWHAHFDRLVRGADRLRIPCPPRELLLHECRQLAGGESSGVLKIILTRGGGGRGYNPPETPQSTRILTQWGTTKDHIDAPFHPRHGVIRPGMKRENPVLAGLKHLNRLEQVMARSEWRDRGIAEGLMQDGRGRIIGGTMSNLFLIRDGRFFTPRLDTCGIAGTVRDLVLRLAGTFGSEVLERDIMHADLFAADGLFLTNALIGVWPVRHLGTREISLDNLPSELLAAVQRASRTPAWGRRE